ncbi:hyaluronidase-1-like [Diadema antillarum]|uniref:hyaluronidase-1-like n=1 Tax=Diadema antillarum TaxID=105358 RepID=UPI003A898910
MFETVNFSRCFMPLLLLCSVAASEIPLSPDKSLVVNPDNFPRGTGRGASSQAVAGESIFRAFWNVPNVCGEKYDVELPLRKFGIEYNSNGQRQIGDVVNVFGHTQIGLYPFIDPDTLKFINGGLPQLANITAHLEKAAVDLLTAIPDPDFLGIGVIDWEAWLPHKILDPHSIYREFSIAHVRNLHPDWDDATITSVATLEWMQGARLFLESTVKLAMQLRPKALWGFYHYPYCNIDKINSSTCDEWLVEFNNKMLWMFNETTAMYPSIYLRPSKSYGPESVIARLKEAFRLRGRSSDPRGVVLSYTRFNYSDTGYYFTFEDLNATILTSAELGTHGVVFWGDAYDNGNRQACLELRDYIEKALGPTLLMARDGAEACSSRVCSGHGRCVGKILSCPGTSRLNRKRPELMPVLNSGSQSGEFAESCSCRCFHGWHGDDCSRPE